MFLQMGAGLLLLVKTIFYLLIHLLEMGAIRALLDLIGVSLLTANPYLDGFNSSLSMWHIWRILYHLHLLGELIFFLLICFLLLRLFRFNTGIHEAEKSIVTSTGNYVITCEFQSMENVAHEKGNFRMLKQGRTDAYQIKVSFASPKKNHC